MYSVRIRYYSPEDTAAMSDVIQHIFEVIETELPAYEAKALIQKFRYDKDDAEAAEALGITKRSFSHYLCTGLKRLRGYLLENTPT
jgi:DNA-directed RNA polymerase specialized sigma24 family protein